MLNVLSTALPVTIPITYDGGTGTNALQLSSGGPAGLAATSDTYTPGAQLGAGTDTLLFRRRTESVNFVNLAPIFDLVPGPLVVNGTNAANAINYAVGFNNLANFLSVTPATTWGQVSVDSYEPIEFINKTTLTINALAGTDNINLHNPNAPTGLTSIAVNGGDPTASDTLVVNGTSATDTINVSPTGPAAASITGAGAITISGTSIKQLVVNGQGGNDTLTVTTPAGANNDTYTPGVAPDAGSFQVGSLVPISYSNLGATGGVSLANIGGRVDTLSVNGTVGNDTFSVASNTAPIPGGVTVNNQLPIATPGVTNLILNGQVGVDTFNINAMSPYANILANSGTNTAFDPLNITGTAGNDAIAVNLQPTMVLGNLVPTITGLGGTIGILGVDAVNIDGGGGTDTLTVSGTNGNEALTYTPTGAAAGNFLSNGTGPLYSFTNITGAFTVNGVGTSNQLTVNGTSNPDTINVDSTKVAVVGLALGQLHGHVGRDRQRFARRRHLQCHAVADHCHQGKRQRSDRRLAG